MTQKKFDPKQHVMNMKGKDYLEVKWRIVWFREEHPHGSITTELANVDPVVMKATVSTVDGAILGTGFGTPKTQGIAKSRPFEGAETAAIGRALASAGYGTQFTGEDEGEHLADAPVEKPKTLRGAYADLIDEAILLKVKDVANYEVGQNTTDDEIRELGKELRAKVDAMKEGK